MASMVIHLAVANEINKKLKKDDTKLLTGSIAPDIAKIVGMSKNISHFIYDEEDIPNLEKFLNKYDNYLNDDFVLGYYIHLYTDYLWYKYFISEVLTEKEIIKKDGKVVKLNGEMARLYIYNDYTNLNIQLINKFNLNLSFLNNKFEIKSVIEEIPIDEIDKLYKAALDIIDKTKLHTSFVFDIKDVCVFIETATNLILAKLNELL